MVLAPVFLHLVRGHGGQRGGASILRKGQQPQEEHVLCLQPGVWKLRETSIRCAGRPGPSAWHLEGGTPASAHRLGTVLSQHQSCVQSPPPSKTEPHAGCLTRNFWKLNGAPNAHMAYWGRSASSTSLLPLYSEPEGVGTALLREAGTRAGFFAGHYTLSPGALSKTRAPDTRKNPSAGSVGSVLG